MEPVPEHELIERGTQRGRLLARGLRRQCPRCGAGGLFPSLLTIHDPCPRCGLVFEREEGYWLGAMVVLFAAVEGLYLAFLAVGILAWWPDVHWDVLLWAGLALNGTVPFLLYRWSKTTWMGIHVAFSPSELEGDEARRTGMS